MRFPTPDIPILGVPLQWWLTFPLIVFCLYALFRWRRFGEDAYTWNHQYFKLALAFGMALCALALFSARLLLEPWQQAALWAAAFTGACLTLRFVRDQDWGNAALLSVAMVGLGLCSLPLAAGLRHALYHPTKWSSRKNSRDPLAGVPRSTFSPEFPAGWQEQSGRSPHTYKRGEEGSGVLQISLFPPADKAAPTGMDAEKELLDAIESVAKDLNLGDRITLSHADGAAGPLAYADYRSDAHGSVRFWMLLSEARVFASYTDGRSPAAEREIAEAHEVLKAARFIHQNSP